MKRKKAPEEDTDEIHEEIETLMYWAEVEADEEHEAYHPSHDQEPCESDIEDDRVGLPGGTSGYDYDELAYTADEEIAS